MASEPLATDVLTAFLPESVRSPKQALPYGHTWSPSRAFTGALCLSLTVSVSPSTLSYTPDDITEIIKPASSFLPKTAFELSSISRIPDHSILDSFSCQFASLLSCLGIPYAMLLLPRSSYHDTAVDFGPTPSVAFSSPTLAPTFPRYTGSLIII